MPHAWQAGRSPIVRLANHKSETTPQAFMTCKSAGCVLHCACLPNTLQYPSVSALLTSASSRSLCSLQPVSTPQCWDTIMHFMILPPEARLLQHLASGLPICDHLQIPSKQIQASAFSQSAAASEHLGCFHSNAACADDLSASLKLMLMQTCS